MTRAEILTVPGMPCDCGCDRFVFVGQTETHYDLECEKCHAEYELAKPKRDQVQVGH